MPRSNASARRANPIREFHGRAGRTISQPDSSAMAASRDDGLTTVTESQSVSIGRSAQLSV